MAEVLNLGGLAIHSSDFTNYSQPFGDATDFSTMDFDCNWWGDAGGPEAVLGPINVAPFLYTPWATSLVAGTGTSTPGVPPCDGGP